MWRMGYTLKPNNLPFVFGSIVLGRGRIARGRNPGCFLMQPDPVSWMAFLVLQPPSRKEKTLNHGQVKRDLKFLFIYLFNFRLSVNFYSAEPSWNNQAGKPLPFWTALNLSWVSWWVSWAPRVLMGLLNFQFMLIVQWVQVVDSEAESRRKRRALWSCWWALRLSL